MWTSNITRSTRLILLFRARTGASDLAILTGLRRPAFALYTAQFSTGGSCADFNRR
jgi:hypothetical protein